MCQYYTNAWNRRDFSLQISENNLTFYYKKACFKEFGDKIKRIYLHLLLIIDVYYIVKLSSALVGIPSVRSVCVTPDRQTDRPATHFPLAPHSQTGASTAAAQSSDLK